MPHLSPRHNFAADECIAQLHIPTLEEKIRASKSFDKNVLVAAHQAALHDAYILEMGTHPVNASPVSPVSPTSSLDGLKAVSLKQLKTGKVHRNRVLRGTLCMKTLCTKGLSGLVVVNVLEDEEGDATPICLSNAFSENYSSAQAQQIYPQGSRVAVKEPYLTELPDGEVGLLVEKSADLVFLWVPEVKETVPEALLENGEEESPSKKNLSALEIEANLHGNGHVLGGHESKASEKTGEESTGGAGAIGNDDNNVDGHGEECKKQLVGENAGRELSAEDILALRDEGGREVPEHDGDEEEKRRDKGGEVGKEAACGGVTEAVELQQDPGLAQAAGKTEVAENVETAEEKSVGPAEDAAGKEETEEEAVVHERRAAETSVGPAEDAAEMAETAGKEEAFVVERGAAEIAEPAGKEEAVVEREAAEPSVGLAEDAAEISEAAGEEESVVEERRAEEPSVELAEDAAEIAEPAGKVEAVVEEREAVEPSVGLAEDEMEIAEAAGKEETEEESVVEERGAEEPSVGLFEDAAAGKEETEEESVVEERGAEEPSVGLSEDAAAIAEAAGKEETEEEEAVVEERGAAEPSVGLAENAAEIAEAEGKQEADVEEREEAEASVGPAEDAAEIEAAAGEEETEKEDAVVEERGAADASVGLAEDATAGSAEAAGKEETEKEAVEERGVAERSIGPAVEERGAAEREVIAETSAAIAEEAGKQETEEEAVKGESVATETAEPAKDAAIIAEAAGKEEAVVDERTAANGGGGETSARLRARGNEYFARAEYKLAAEMYSRAAEGARREEKPEEEQLALSNRAEAWLKLGRSEPALEDSEAALRILGGAGGVLVAKVLFRKGRALMDLRRYEEAMGVLQQVLETAPSDKQLREAAISCRARLKHLTKPGKRQRAAASRKQQRQLPP